MSEREEAVLRLAIRSVLCLSLEHFTLLAGEEFGGKPSPIVIGSALQECTAILNGVVNPYGGMTIEDDYVAGFVEMAWSDLLKQRDQRAAAALSQPFSPLSAD